MCYKRNLKLIHEYMSYIKYHLLILKENHSLHLMVVFKNELFKLYLI